MGNKIIVSFLLVSSVLAVLSEAQTRKAPTLVKGLSWNFHESTCPNLEKIIRDQLKKEFKKDIQQAAGLLRLHFHDCFVQGCDGSVLLKGSASGPGEQDAPPNLTLREKGFAILNDLRRQIHDKCGRTVSCSDILAIAARDAVALSGGPNYKVPLGRRDSLNFATREATLANLPGPNSNVTQLIRMLSDKNFDITDVVALSGGHTIGISHCTSFTSRLYPSQDPVMEKTFANKLKTICPTPNANNTTFLDLRTPNTFDNKYYVDLMNRQGVFFSDQDLYTDKRTKEIVKRFAIDQKLFFDEFVKSMTKMGQLSVLTGNNGEIRSDCFVRNKDTKLASVVDDEVVMSAF